MTTKQFDKWLHDLKLAWETTDPQAAVNLCAEKVEWHEVPFGQPYTTRQEVLDEWQDLSTQQKDIQVTYEIITVSDSFGIAHWNAKFTRLPSGEKAHLDGIYKVSLDENNLCTEFHQWYNSE